MFTMKIQVVVVLAAVDLFTVIAVEKLGQCPDVGAIKGGNCATDYDCSGLDKCCQGTCAQPECPNKSQPCTFDPCQLAACDAVPRAYCRQDPCSCKVTWSTDGGDVTALCTGDEGDMQFIVQDLWYNVDMLGSRSKRNAYKSGWQSLKELRRTAKALRKKQRQIAKKIKRERRKGLNATSSEIDQMAGTTTSGATNNVTTVAVPTTSVKPTVPITTDATTVMKKKQRKDKKKRKQERMKKKEARRKRKEEKARKRKERLNKKGKQRI